MISNVGSINIAHVDRVPHLVRPGETLSSHSYRQVLGGKGANQTIAIARAGAAVSHIGAIGHQDAWVTQPLASAGATIDHIAHCQDLLSGHAIIQVDDDAENSIVLFHGANGAMPLETITAPLARGGADDWLLVQNECAHLSETLEQAHRQGMSIAFNPAPMTAAVARLPLEGVSLLFVNEGEAIDLLAARENVEDAQIRRECDTADALMARLHRHFPDCACVLTLGAKGALYSDGQVQLNRAAYRVNAVDTTAAGDTFVGYFMAATVRGATPQQALNEAVAAAALCVQKEGASSSIPERNDVMALLNAAH